MPPTVLASMLVEIVTGGFTERSVLNQSGLFKAVMATAITLFYPQIQREIH